MLEDAEPRPKPSGLAPPNLESWGLAELEAYIRSLRAEIARAEAEIARKGAHRSAADAFFKRPGG
jgi:uncharacterized small protein (DUF1192 family)